MSFDDNDSIGHYEGVLLEEIRDHVKGIAEGLSGLSDTVVRIDQRLGQIEQNTNLIPSIKAAVTDQNKDIAKLGGRISTLEEAKI